jgi:hypothetical protein
METRREVLESLWRSETGRRLGHRGGGGGGRGGGGCDGAEGGGGMAAAQGRRVAGADMWGLGPSEGPGLVPEYQAQIMGRRSVIDGVAPEMGVAATRGKNSGAQSRDVELNMPKEGRRGGAATGAKNSEVQSDVHSDVAVQHALLDKRDQCAEWHMALDPRLRPKALIREGESRFSLEQRHGEVSLL